MPVKDMVAEGYRSLAARTLSLFDTFTATIPRQHGDADKALRLYRQNLAQLRRTGDIFGLGADAKENFLDIVSLVEQAVPSPLKPQEPQDALMMALEAVQAYEGIASIDLLVHRLGVSEINITDKGGAGIAYLESTETGHKKKIFFAQYKPRMQAHSVVVNVHEMWHCLQPEHQEVDAILAKHGDIPGYDGLADAVYHNPDALRKMIDVCKETHMLHFLSGRQARAIAQRTGVDVAALDAFLDENTAELTFLRCLTEGDAYLAQRDIVVSSPRIQGQRRGQALYKLLALSDALSAPFQKPSPMVYHAGIGLVSFMRNHPEAEQEIRTSKAVHDEIEATYFRKA